MNHSGTTMSDEQRAKLLLLVQEHDAALRHLTAQSRSRLGVEGLMALRGALHAAREFKLLLAVELIGPKPGHPIAMARIFEKAALVINKARTVQDTLRVRRDNASQCG